MIFDWREGRGAKLDQPYPVELNGFADSLLLLAPIRNGWAVIGARDKYLSPAAVQSVDAGSGILQLEMVESGPLLIWSAEGMPKAEGIPAKDLGGGFWQFDLPAAAGGKTITFTR